MIIKFKNTYRFRAFDKDGKLKWQETVNNMVVDAGCNDVLTQYLKGSAYTAAFYLGLKGSGSVAAGDTMSSHAGWSEVTGYSEGARQTITFGSVASKSVDNTASPCQYSINATVTVAGAFITTNNTKGGITGTLFGAADFTSPRSLVSGDTLNIDVTITTADA